MNNEDDFVERDYSDIIDLPHPEPVHHHRMPTERRASRWQSFAALPQFFEDIAKMRKEMEK